MSPDHLRRHELDGLRRRGLVPMALVPSGGCPGRVLNDDARQLLDICKGCALYGVGDIENFIDPPAVLAPDGWFCANRRCTGTHRPAVVCAAGVGSVCADAYSVHDRTLAEAGNAWEPLVRAVHPDWGVA